MAHTDKKPSNDEMLKWDAESIVRKAIEKTPAYNQAIRETMKQLRQTQQQARKIISGKPQKKK